MGVALLGGVVAVAVQGQVPGDAAQKGLQPFGLFRRDGLPGLVPGVADTFFRILGEFLRLLCRVLSLKMV